MSRIFSTRIPTNFQKWAFPSDYQMCGQKLRWISIKWLDSYDITYRLWDIVEPFWHKACVYDCGIVRKKNWYFSRRHEITVRLLDISCIDMFIFWWLEAWNCKIKILIKSFFALCQVLNSRHWHHQSHSTNHPLKGGKLPKRIHLFKKLDHPIRSFHLSQRRIYKL